MNNLNSVLVEGNLTKDALLNEKPNGVKVCTFTITHERYFKEAAGLEKEVSYFDVETSGKLAETASGVARKGRGVRVVGRIKQERWDGVDGKPHSHFYIVAEHVEFRPESTSTSKDYEEEKS